MSGYASVESSENLPVATPKVEMVEVEAPGTLSAGYTFQASYNGVVFPVTVVRATSEENHVSVARHLVLTSCFLLMRSLLEEYRKDKRSLFPLQIMKRPVS